MTHKLVLPKYPDHIVPSRYNQIVDLETAKLLHWCKKQGIGYANTMPAVAMKAAKKTGAPMKGSLSPMKGKKQSRGLATPLRGLTPTQKKQLAKLKQGKGQKRKKPDSGSDDDDGDDADDDDAAAAKKPTKQAEYVCQFSQVRHATISQCCGNVPRTG